MQPRKTHYKKIVLNGQRIDEHRHIMQQKVGRRLDFNEVVHHKDENKLNNDESNLVIIPRSEHSRLHAKERVYGQDFKDKMRRINLEIMVNSKLCESDVKTIKQLLKEGVRQANIARMFNVAKNTICDIANNRTWTHC